MEKQTTIRLFGILSDIVGKDYLEINNVEDTDNLLIKLNHDFPLLVNNKFRIAVDNNFIETNTLIEPGSIVALMPPFSGG